MTRRQAHVIALGIAYRAVAKALQAGGDEAGDHYDDQGKVDDALDAIAQRLYERWKDAGGGP